MEQQVREMEPILAKKAEEGNALVNRLKVEQKAADQVKAAVLKDEAAAKVRYFNRKMRVKARFHYKCYLYTSCKL